MKRLLFNLTMLAAAALAAGSFIVGAAVAWLLLRFLGRGRQGELDRAQRELASQRTRTLEAERQLTLLARQSSVAPTPSRRVAPEDGRGSSDALASEAAAAIAQLETTADIQALDSLLSDSEPALAEVEVLQAGLEAGEEQVEPGLANRSGAVELLIGEEQPVEDDLTRIEGIGPTYAGRLRDHGIVTFAQLAQSSEDELAEISQAPAWRRPNFAGWIAQARLAATGDEDALAALQDELSRRRGDNLALIEGLGEKYTAALQAAGIDSFSALAESTPEQLAAIVSEAGLRSGNFAAWIDEAALRADGKRVVRRSNADTP